MADIAELSITIDTSAAVAAMDDFAAAAARLDAALERFRESWVAVEPGGCAPPMFQAIPIKDD